MDTHFDNETYWNRSSSKAFSFDDDESASTAAAAASSVSSLDLSVPSLVAPTAVCDDAISEASFENAAGSALSLSIKSILSDEALKVILQEQTLDDRLLSKGVTPEEELRSLRRQIQTTLYSAAPELTAQKLLKGKVVPLEVFKSLHEKEQLLDELLRHGGGDAVLGVVLFLKRTLNTANFYRILQQRPLVLQQYVSFLQQCHGESAVQFLRLFGKQQQAALLQFHMLFKCQDIDTRKQKLRQLHETYSDTAINSLYQQLFQTNLKLLDFIAKERNALDNLVNLNSTAIEVLYACSRKHSNWKEPQLQNAISPYRFTQEQQISAAQFEWTVLNERTSAQAYADLEAIFERVPSWNPMKQKQFHISFSLDLAILRLQQLQAPMSVLYLFLTKMSNSQEKLELAQRVQCAKAVIDALQGLKQLEQLLLLKETLAERSEEQFYCDKAIKSLQHKRWSTDNINLKLKL